MTTKHLLQKIRVALFLGFLLFASLFAIAQVDPAIKVEKIWDQGLHNAFTDLLRFNNRFYCTFREGSAHVKGNDGTARVIMSEDGKKWVSVAHLKLPGKDIRDPKISISPDNRIMVLMDVETTQEGKVIGRNPFVSFSDAAGNSFSEPKESKVDKKIASWSDWVWRVTWYNGTGYSILYQPAGAQLVKTKDGLNFEWVCKIDIDGYPNESTIRFDKDGKMYIMIRREQLDKMGVIATANAPFTDWKYSYMSQRIGGPNFLFLNDSTLCVGSRLYPQEEVGGTKFHQSAVFLTDLNGSVKKIIRVPSGGDASYPGMVLYDGFLWYSYYSSHEEKTNIYLAKIPLDKLTYIK